jgi:hypothetical protein
MSAVETALRPVDRRRRASTRWVVLITLIAVVGVLAMHGLGPHHAGRLTTSMTVPAAAMAAEAPNHDDRASSHHQDTPTSTHELAAPCAVIVLAAVTLVTRRTTTLRHTLWSTLPIPETGSRPDPPVPRLTLAFS